MIYIILFFLIRRLLYIPVSHDLVVAAVEIMFSTHYYDHLHRHLSTVHRQISRLLVLKKEIVKNTTRPQLLEPHSYNFSMIESLVIIQ